jgi:hypothetical protein
MSLDDRLRRALGSRPAPDGFEERVMARLAARTPASVSSGSTSGRPHLHRPWRWAAAAALVAAMAGGAGYYQHQARVDAGARAADELRTALAIASDKLAIAQQRVQHTAARQF